MASASQLSAVSTSYVNEARLPIVYEPAQDSASSLEYLSEWLRDNEQRFNADLRAHGAVLFRGFKVPDAPAFERVARAVDPGLVTRYPGISPREHISEHVLSSTELPSYFPLPQHSELSYTHAPPRKIFFFCVTPPASGGETPLCDLRKVLSDLPPALRSRFERDSIRYVRVHGSPADKQVTLWGGKRWNDVFETTERSEVEKNAREQQLELTWLPGDRLKLESILPAVRRHPLHDTPAWHNHLVVFHPDAGLEEAAHIARYRPDLRSVAAKHAIALLSNLRRWFVNEERYELNTTYGDGAPIPRADLHAVVETIWRNLASFPWRAGDVLAIDNFSVSHGRLPFRGKRKVLVAMTDGYAPSVSSSAV